MKKLTLESLYSQLMEKLITFGKAYPKSGNVVILAGGAGSGKGFIKDKLLGIEGYTFDVDNLKLLALKSPKIIQKVKKEFGRDITKLSLKNPKDVSMLHDLIGSQLNIPNKKQAAIFSSILTTSSHEKPNLIFDVTLKDLNKLDDISRFVVELGYDKKNIHIVWVLNDVEVAKKQNAERERRVDVNILINTHNGVSQTMGQIITMGEELQKYMDGYIVIAFNKIFVDTELVKSDKGGSYLKKANYVVIKEKGKPQMTMEEIGENILKKIRGYVPNANDWAWTAKK